MKPNVSAEAQVNSNITVDEDIIKAAKAGDSLALEFLINKYKS